MWNSCRCSFIQRAGDYRVIARYVFQKIQNLFDRDNLPRMVIISVKHGDHLDFIKYAAATSSPGNISSPWCFRKTISRLYLLFLCMFCPLRYLVSLLRKPLGFLTQEFGKAETNGNFEIETRICGAHVQIRCGWSPHPKINQMIKIPVGCQLWSDLSLWAVCTLITFTFQKLDCLIPSADTASLVLPLSDDAPQSMRYV